MGMWDGCRKALRHEDGDREVYDSGNQFKPWRSQLGSPRMSYAKWAASPSCSPYPWPLWRHFKGATPVTVETVEQVRRRQLSGKPAGYSWKLERRKAA